MAQTTHIVVADLEPDILESEVKWALESMAVTSSFHVTMVTSLSFTLYTLPTTTLIDLTHQTMVWISK